MSSCLSCGTKLKRTAYKYCSNKCQQVYQYKNYIEKWKAGLVKGDRGIITKNISTYIKRYLIDKYGETCSLCGWGQRHPITTKVPLELDHTDGNAENNKEENLRLICPNCHSLTSNFRNLNKGKGRAWRTLKYMKTIN